MFKSLRWWADEVFYRLSREGTPAPGPNPLFSARADVSMVWYWMHDYGLSPDYTGSYTGGSMRLYDQVNDGPQSPDGSGYGWGLPDYGLGMTGVTASGRNMEVAYLGVKIYAEDDGTWTTHTEGVRVRVDGATVYQDASVRETRGVIPRNPAGVPIFGYPPTISGTGTVNPQSRIPANASGGTAGHGGNPSPDTGTSEGAALGSWGFRRGSEELRHKMLLTSPDGGVSLSEQGDVGRCAFKDHQGGTVVEKYGGELTLMPNPPKGVVRMETPYEALVERYGFPRIESYRNYDSRVEDTSVFEENYNPQFEEATDVRPAKGHILARAGDVAAGDLETPLSLGCPTPYRFSRSRRDIGFSASTVTASEAIYASNLGGSDANVNGQTPISGPNGLAPYLRSRWVQLFTLFNTWANPHWSYGLPTLAWEDLPNEYWWNVRQQKISSPALPSGDDTDERTQIVTEGLDQAGAFPLDQYNTLGLASAWGLAGFKTRTLTALDRTYDAASAGAWSVRVPEGAEEPNASLAFGSSGVTVSGWQDDEATVLLDLGRWDAPPAMLWRAAKDLTLARPAVNAASFRVFLEGLDGERLEVLVQGSVFTVKPVRANARRPTGTYTGDSGAGEFDDAGIPLTPFVLGPPTKGDVAFRADIDPEISLSLLTPSVGSWARLAIEIEPLDRAQPVTIAWPTIHGADLSKARVRREGARYASILLEDGPPLRFGQDFRDPTFDVLLDTPFPPDPIAAPTVGDGLFWEQTVLRGLPATTDSYARVDELYEAGIEFTIAKHAFRKAVEDGGFILVNHSFLCGGDGGRPVMLFADAFQSAPLATFPDRKRTREANWGQTGAYGAWSYGIASPVRSVIAPDRPGRPPAVSLYDPSSYTTLSDAPDADLPSGWLGRSVRVAISTTAGAQDRDRYLDLGGSHMARVGLRRGFLLAWGEPPKPPATGYVALSVSANFVHVLGEPAPDGTLTLSRANNAAPTEFLDAYATAIKPEWVDLCHAPGRPDQIWIAAVEDGTARVLRAAFGGEPVLMATVGDAEYASLDWSRNNVLHHYRLDPEGALHLSRYDLLGNALGEEVATNVAGLDSAPIVCRCSVAGGALVITLAASRDGERIVLRSEGGVTFA